MSVKPYDEYKKIIDAHLSDFLPSIDRKSRTVEKAMKYSLDAGGKRLRPALLLAACEFAGGDAAAALPYACALEYIHTYSLIHDDLPSLDNDDLRRGVPTNHKVFGDAMALLAGDGLLSCAFEAINRDMLLYLDDQKALNARVKAAYEISKGAGCRGMVAGQVADVEAEGKQCSPDLLEYIHLNKTAAMITAAVRAGAHLGNASEGMLNDLTVYGESIGLAFQIADDILDITGSEEEFGKPIGSDAANGKATYPAIYGIDKSRERLEELTQKAVDAVEGYGEGSDFFADLAVKLLKRTK